VASDNIFEVFFILSGELSFQFGDRHKEVTVPALTYVEIQQGVPFSMTNKGHASAESLAISVIAPECPPGVGGLPLDSEWPSGASDVSHTPGRE
jgi:mannose-6-phosphate isomerase-like protein (cupin superfamily)